jgi:alkanesulfonate monooxygenase SsuD/methylene tetrahydromethanopterin reductase-like flavin-dependent oxidoreductase (luciferase family)
VAELARLATVAEALGAAAILVADEGTDRDLYVTLTALAQHTSRVLLVGAVTNPHSRHPVATAAAFASLAELAPGRIVAGFGTGGSRVFGPMHLQPRRPFTALVECVDICAALWRGEVVDHAGELGASHAALAWSPGPLPIAIAGRGPRVEQFAARRADWMLLAGRPVDSVAGLIGDLRAVGQATNGRPAAMAWNPSAAWTEAMIAETRTHLAYMAVDMPSAERTRLGLDDAQTAHLRDIVTAHGPEAAGALLPDALLERYAVTGSRSAVVRRLAALLALARPELLLFEAGDYSAAYLESAAAVVLDAGGASL